ncbi:MAG: BamA/OMP85 family outer membrane protein [Bacteroidota bacterium]
MVFLFLAFGVPVPILQGALLSESLRESSNEVQNRPEIVEIKFVGNSEISSKLLRSRILTRVSPSAISQFFYEHISERLGSPPVFYDPYVAGADIARLENFYRDHGFFSARVDTTTKLLSNGESLVLTFRISEGPRFVIDSVRFAGLSGVDSALLVQINSQALMRVGEPFTAEAYNGDRNRIITLLGNHGYPNASVDSKNSQVLIDSVRHKVVPTITFSLGGQYTFGDIQIKSTHGSVRDEAVVYRQLDFRPGELYSRQKLDNSERNLNRLGVFESVRIEMSIPSPESIRVPIPIIIQLQPRPLNELTPEVLANDENNAFNLGIGLGYSNLDFIGGARRLTLRGRFRVQSLTHVNFGRIITKTGFREPNLVANAELTLQLTQPYVFSNRTSGNWSLTATADKQLAYLQTIFRNKIGIVNQRATYTFAFLDWSLERVSLDSVSPDFRSLTLAEEDKPQFNSILSFTLQRDKTNDVFSPSAGFFNSGVIEEAGLFPLLLKKFGIPMGGLPFSQYAKVILLGRWYKDLWGNRLGIFAWKIKLGAAVLLARSNTTPIPLNRRFFAGGSGSVRGWRTRELGAVTKPEFGGNALVEMNFELRWNGLRKLGSPIGIPFEHVWLVPFLDAGNIWATPADIRPSQFAIASGIGFRYDTIAGPLRIDYGIRIYDPKGVSEHQWFFQQRFFSDVLAHGVIHFGLGHAF